MSSLQFSVVRQRLSNGLSVVINTDETAPRAVVYIGYRVGSRNEAPGLTGLAHFTEHLMFHGSAHVPKNKHIELIQGVGGSLNASTWFDHTNYFQIVPSHYLELPLWLEADRLGWPLPTIDPDAFQTEKNIVQNEIRQVQDNQPYGDSDKRVHALLFPEGHPYRHTVYGSLEDLNRTSIDDVVAFRNAFYVPNNAALVIAGDVHADAGIELAERYFAEIAPRPTPSAALSVPPTIGGRSIREYIAADVPLTRVTMAFQVPPYNSPEYPVSDVCRALLGEGRAGRLYRALVVDQKIASKVDSRLYPLFYGASILLLEVTGTTRTRVEQLESAVEGELETLTSITDDEVERAKALCQLALAERLEHVGRRAGLLSMLELHLNDSERLNLLWGRSRSVTCSQVAAFVSEWLGPDNRVIVAYSPLSR